MTEEPATARPLPAATDRVWTIPNILSFLRLAGVPLFIYLLLGPQADGWAISILMVAGVTDWADGKLARMLNQSSRLGALLDPAADRLYILATLIAFVIRDVVPVWVVAVILGRDVLVGLSLLVLRRHGYRALQVNYVGKAATFNLLYAFPLLLLAVGSSGVAEIVAPVAYAFTAWGGMLYVISGIAYVRQVLEIAAFDTAAETTPDTTGYPADDSAHRRLRPTGATLVTGTEARSESILRKLLDETLDPGYQEAAERRAAAADSPNEPAKWKRRLVLAGCLLLIGALSTVVISQVRSSAPQRAELRQALIEDITAQRAVGDLLQQRLVEVRDEATRAREQLLAATTQGQGALDELDRAENGAGLTAVQGPGLVITLTDAPLPEGGGDNLGRILDRDIQSVVNELWAAGAEAVAVDGQRLGPTTSIRSAGQAILVDFRPVTNPYLVEAIGPAGMFDQFLESSAGRTLASYASAFGLGLDVVPNDQLDLLPGTGGVVNRAEPVELRSDSQGEGDR